MRRQGSTRNRGATLVLVTVIGVIMAVLGMSMIELGRHARITAVRDTEKVKARSAADAGVAEAFHRMQAKLLIAHNNHDAWGGPIDAVANAALPGTNATYSYQVNAASGCYEIVSTGTCAGMIRTIHAVVDLDSYADGVGVDKTLDAKNGTYFGAVGPGLQGLKVRSNSVATDAMIFRTNVTVDGDVYCGPGGNTNTVIEVKNNVSINGLVDSSTYTMVWPPVTAPENLVAGPAITGAVSLPQGRYEYANLDLANTNPATVLRIAPDPTGAGQPTVIYVADTMTMGQGAEIIVETGAYFELYIGEALISGNSAGIGNDVGNYAANLKIFGLPTCNQIILKTKTDTYACVYAPSADLDLFNSGNYYGSIVADSFEMKNSGNFYFDTRLKIVDIDDVLARFVITRWWEG